MVGNLDPELQQKTFLHRLIQLNAETVGRYILGRTAHDRSRRQGVAGRRDDLDNDSFIARLAAVLSAVLILGHRITLKN
jgi:hypothetical protein